MAGLQGVLDIGRGAIIATQAALQTISHNIANANVEGFSRQEAVFTTNIPTQSAAGLIGTGVLVENIRRGVDNFINEQIVLVKQALRALEAKSGGLRQVEAVFNEAREEVGINTALDAFFARAQDLSNNPGGVAERTSLVLAAQDLGDRIASLVRSIREVQANVNLEVSRTVDEVNDIAARLANLNDLVARNEAGTDRANDFRDARQRLLEELAEKIGLNSLEQADKRLLVLVGRGFPLVQGSEAFTLVTSENPDRAVGVAPPTPVLEVNFKNAAGTLTKFTDRIDGGKLGGLIELRDVILEDMIDTFDKLAAALITEVNIVHREGFGLTGQTGVDFFQPLSLTSQALSTNSTEPVSKNLNAVVVTGESGVVDPTALTGADYEVEFITATTFTVRDRDTGKLLNATQVAVNGVLGTDPGVTSFTYSGPSTRAEFQGLRVVIGNAAGVPAAGDKFALSLREGAAVNLRVNSAVIQDANLVAAARTPTPGDNANALALVALREKKVVDRDTATFQGFYNNLVSNFGAKARTARADEAIQDDNLQQLFNRRDVFAGVSLDEELANMLRFQQNFGAAARVIGVTSQLLQQILDIL